MDAPRVVKSVRVGEMLISSSACPPEALEEALHNQSFFGGRLGTNLLQMGVIQERQLVAALARLHRVRGVSGELAPEPDAVALVSRSFVERYEVVPCAVVERSLRLVMRDPGDLEAIDEIAFATGRKIERVVAAEARVWSLMRRHYGVERKLRGIDDAWPRWAPRIDRGRGSVQPIAVNVWR